MAMIRTTSRQERGPGDRTGHATTHPLAGFVTALGVGLLAATNAWATPGSADTVPPGNNGTVKVDAEPFDDHPDNQPHVGCTFQIDFYGYDEGDLTASYAFLLWPPTGSGQLYGGTLYIGEESPIVVLGILPKTCRDAPARQAVDLSRFVIEVSESEDLGRQSFPNHGPSPVVARSVAYE
jgi:hypothetical protein